MEIKQKVTNCVHCAFFNKSQDMNATRYGCVHPEIRFKDIDTRGMGLIVDNVPQWCPLRKSSFTIFLYEKNKYHGVKNG